MPVSRGNQMSKEWYPSWNSSDGGGQSFLCSPLGEQSNLRWNSNLAPHHCQVCLPGHGLWARIGLGCLQSRQHGPFPTAQDQ